MTDETQTEISVNSRDDDLLEGLFAAARTEALAPLSPKLMRKMVQDAKDWQSTIAPAPNPAPVQEKAPLTLRFWAGLQEAFGGRGGLAGAGAAMCLAFGVGAWSPDMSLNMLVLSGSDEFAGLVFDADPEQLWPDLQSIEE